MFLFRTYSRESSGRPFFPLRIHTFLLELVSGSRLPVLWNGSACGQLGHWLRSGLSQRIAFIFSRCSAQYRESPSAGSPQTLSFSSVRDGGRIHSHVRWLIKIL